MLTQLPKDLGLNIDFEKRFSNRVQKGHGNACWEWIGNKDRKGYGRMQVSRKNILGHRLSYILHVGNIPEGQVIHHECNNKSCVNPKHLKAVTIAENNAHTKNDFKFVAKNALT